MSAVVYFLFSVISGTVVSLAMVPMLITSITTMALNPNAVAPEAMLLTMLIVSFLAFLAFQVIPGDPTNTILGTDATAVINKFRTHMPQRFTVAQGNIRAMGALFEIDPDAGRTVSVKRITF